MNKKRLGPEKQEHLEPQSDKMGGVVIVPLPTLVVVIGWIIPGLETWMRPMP